MSVGFESDAANKAWAPILKNTRCKYMNVYLNWGFIMYLNYN